MYYNWTHIISHTHLHEYSSLVKQNFLPLKCIQCFPFSKSSHFLVVWPLLKKHLLLFLHIKSVLLSLRANIEMYYVLINTEKKHYFVNQIHVINNEILHLPLLKLKLANNLCNSHLGGIECWLLMWMATFSLQMKSHHQQCKTAWTLTQTCCFQHTQPNTPLLTKINNLY